MEFPRWRKSPPPAPSVPAPAVSSEVFFGVLRSEFDTPDTLPPAFAASADAFTAVVAAYREGLLEPDTTADYLSRMYLTDHNGMQWTAGPTTLRWYRRLPGGTWSSALPPMADDAELEASCDELLAVADTVLALARDEALRRPAPAPVAPVPATAPLAQSGPVRGYGE